MYETEMAMLLESFPNLEFVAATQDNFIHVCQVCASVEAQMDCFTHSSIVSMQADAKYDISVCQKLTSSHAGAGFWDILPRSWHGLT